MLLRRMITHVKAQNWTAVALDFVIVVIGVGVALMAEQWLSGSQQRAEFKVAERSLRADVFSNYLFAKERIALTKCRRQNLRDIAERLQTPEWEPLPTGQVRSLSAFVFPAIYSTPSRPWGSRIWDAELNRGSLSGLSVDQRAQLSLYFYGAQTIGDLQAQILDESASLKSLAYLTDLTASDRARYLDAIMRIDNSSAVIELIANQMVSIVDDLQTDESYSDEELASMRQGLSQLSSAGQGAYGDCYQPLEAPFLSETPS